MVKLCNNFKNQSKTIIKSKTNIRDHRRFYPQVIKALHVKIFDIIISSLRLSKLQYGANNVKVQYVKL